MCVIGLGKSVTQLIEFDWTGLIQIVYPVRNPTRLMQCVPPRPFSLWMMTNMIFMTNLNMGMIDIFLARNASWLWWFMSNIWYDHDGFYDQSESDYDDIFTDHDHDDIWPILFMTNMMTFMIMINDNIFTGMSPAPATARAGRSTPSQVPRWSIQNHCWLTGY